VNYYLNRTARKKVTTGTELLVADATVAEVYFRLMLYMFIVNVFLHIFQDRAQNHSNDLLTKKSSNFTLIMLHTLAMRRRIA
jgi:hypothetical protein